MKTNQFSFARTLAASGLATLILALPLAAHAHDAKLGVINVSATGIAKVKPDMAILSLSVLREAETAREALDENTKAMKQVLEAMKATYVAERDLQTSNFNIQPRYFYPKQDASGAQEPPRIIGYTVSNSLTVRIRDLTKLGEIMDKSVTLGVNSGGSIQFTTDDPTAALQDARKKAMASAIAKAKTLATAAGASLGNIKSISEAGRGQPRPRSLARTSSRQLAAAPEAAPVPVASGENTYSITVNVQWELDQ